MTDKNIVAKQIVSFIQNNVGNTQVCIDFVDEELQKLSGGDKYFHLSSVRSAVEFGFKGHEAGNNLEKVLADFDKLIGDEL